MDLQAPRPVQGIGCAYSPLSDPERCGVCPQEENGGAGVYSADLRKHYLLENPAWKRDIMPEIVDGKNVLDYVDPDIEAKLMALEQEEEALAAAAAIEVRISQS